jgi:hypothetical protein
MMPSIILHVLLQILDGILTYMGVTILAKSTEIEGNPMLKWLMNEIGVVLAIVIVKSCAVLIILTLNKSAKKSVMLRRCLFAVNLIYILVCAMWVLIFLI